MNQPHLAHRLARPAVLSLARREAALKDAARRLRRWPREGARPSLTAAPRLAVGCSGRDGKTALQPNRKTAMAVGDWRTTHALQKADMFTRHRQATERPVVPWFDPDACSFVPTCHRPSGAVSHGHNQVGAAPHDSPHFRLLHYYAQAGTTLLDTAFCIRLGYVTRGMTRSVGPASRCRWRGDLASKPTALESQEKK